MLLGLGPTSFAAAQSAQLAESRIEKYTPQSEYFTQRKEEPEARKWKMDGQPLPPIGSIVARPQADRPVYGVYAWCSEYVLAREEIKKMGVRSIRLAGPWEEADTAMRAAAEDGVEVLYTIQGGRTPAEHRRNNRAAFASDEEFIGRVAENVSQFVKRYGPAGSFTRETGLKSPLRVVEIWNEPNFQYMIPDRAPRTEVEAERTALYPKLLKAAYAAAKKADPEVVVAGFAAGGADAGDQRFIKAIHEQDPGISASYDILTTHPYLQGAPPEASKIRRWGSYSIAEGLAPIRGYIGSPAKPVWYSEIGWEIAQKHGGLYPVPDGNADGVVPPDLHAAYIVRMYLWAMRLGVERVFIMHLHDTDGYNGGLIVRKTNQWRPAAYAIKNLTEQLPNPKMVEARLEGEGGTYAYVFQSDGSDPAKGKVIVAWNVPGPKRVEFAVEGTGATLFDMVGNRKAAELKAGKLQVEVGPYPLFIRSR